MNSIRTIIAASAVAAAGMFGVGAPVTAAPSGTPSAVTAVLAAPARDARVVAGNTLWLCQGETCVARAAAARPSRLCRDLKRKAGTVVSLTVNGTALDSAALARCNA
ncbi:hypothetical protein EYB45_10495 [Erythrobacteraceae bacterium CFH 75059]|uniref:CC_3452 family protein n=1 Tax=Qipengyuania thermophila TaxID=2509361 RepID=UPI0010226E47|nr:hypothetical protein [Qipengyuania thermophila]TCD02093.1 hypothetical protein EYB45_10495 [Erythrobacteraceae bacterium CFH 75059]